MAAVPSGWKGVLGMPQENSRDRDACVRIHKSPSRTWRWEVGQQVNDTHRRSAKRKLIIKKTQPLLPAPAWLTGRVGNNRASTVDADICRQSRVRGTHTALKRCMHHCPSIRRGNCGSSSQDPPNHLCICIFHSAENRWHSEGVG